MQTEAPELSPIRSGSIAAFHPKAEFSRANISTPPIAASGRGCVKTQIPKIRVVNCCQFAWFFGLTVG